MKYKKLVILTTHFGCNFSGGSLATCEIFRRLQDQFENITIVCNRAGDHPFHNLQIKVYKNFLHALNILAEIHNDNTVFYGDIYNAYWFVLLNKPFYFTYHDNWPEIASTSWLNRIRALFYNPVYRLIFRQAQVVFTVSAYKAQYLKKYNPNIHLVRNGINLSEFKTKPTNDNINNAILMIGNIDKRKYIMAVKLFKQLKLFDGEIHIYGSINDQRIADQLRQFSFTKLYGFKSKIPYQQYRLLLHTSMMENLSMVWCEALAVGLPVVTFDVGGASEVVNENNGVLISPYDIDATKKAVFDILHHKVLFQPEIRLSNSFSWDRASKQYQKLMCA